MNRNPILVVDDDSSVRRVMKMQLEEAGYQVTLAADGEEAQTLIDEQPPKLVITDLRMPCSGGLDLLRYVHDGGLETTVIIVTAFGTIETAVEAMKAGLTTTSPSRLTMTRSCSPCIAPWSGKACWRRFATCARPSIANMALRIS